MARVLGADVYVHWSMGLVPLTLIALLAPERPPLEALTWTFVWCAAATAVVWSHGLAHLWASGALAVGSGTVLLTPLAPLAHGAPPAPIVRAEVRAALAGPACHGLWALLGAIALRVLPWSRGGADMLEFFVWANIALSAVNLLPFHPLDGGRVLRTLLTPRLGDVRAEAWTASAGYGGAVVLGLTGLTLLLSGNAVYATWAVFLVAVGVLTLTASQRALFSAQFRSFAPRPARPAVPAPLRAPDILDAEHLAFLDLGTGDDMGDDMGDDTGDDMGDDMGNDAGNDMGDHAGNDASTEHVVESAEQRRERLQDRIDALLDRINEVGGLSGLSPDERRELAEASEMLRRETADR